MKDVNVILSERPGLGRVRLCDCDAIHVSIGPVTINLEPEAFAQMTALMRTALDQLTQITEAKSECLGGINAFGSNRSQLTH